MFRQEAAVPEVSVFSTLRSVGSPARATNGPWLRHSGPGIPRIVGVSDASEEPGERDGGGAPGNTGGLSEELFEAARVVERAKRFLAATRADPDGARAAEEPRTLVEELERAAQEEPGSPA